MSVSIDTVEDLKEIGIKPLLAKTLFKLIGEWKTQGLPADFLKDLMRATGSGATAQARPKEVADI